MRLIKKLIIIAFCVMLISALAVSSHALNKYDTGTYRGYDCRGTLYTTGYVTGGVGNAITRYDYRSGTAYSLYLKASYYVQYTNGDYSNATASEGISSVASNYITAALMSHGTSPISKCHSAHIIHEDVNSISAWNGSVTATAGIDF